MNKHLKWLIPLVVIAATAAWYLLQYRQPGEQVADHITSEPESQASISTPTQQYPLAGQSESSLPDLDNSDESIKTSLERLFGTDDFTAALIPTFIVRHIVATVDNLPRQKLAVQLRSLRATPGAFVVTGSEGDWVLAEKNAARYASFMHLVQIVSVEQVAAWYRQYYPLFQQAYQGLGYPQSYFNDRLVQAIDDLLATPELTALPRLVSPHVLYEFADPDLEARSAGQKLLLRMGSANSKIIKEKLRQLRVEITKPTA